MSATKDQHSEPARVPSNSVRKRLGAIVAAGAILVLGAGLYLHFTFNRPVGSGPAGPAVPAPDFVGAWTERPVLLVGLGDSVTAGFGARHGYGYFERLIANPIDEFAGMKGLSLGAVFPHLRVTNLAVSGSISIELAEGQLPLLPVADDSTLGWVVITTGGNDLIHNYGRTPPREQAMYGAGWEQAKPWIEHFSKRLELIVDRLAVRFPGGCHIFLANIYDPTDGVGDVERAGLPAWPDGARILAAYNDALSQCAKNHSNVHLVNFHEAFLGHGIHCAQFWSRHYDSKDPHYWYFTNLEDPNERGYDVIRRLFLIEMAAVGRQLKQPPNH